MFDILHQLPIFQGLSHEDCIEILEKVNLCFTNHPAGKRLVWADTPCNRLFYLLQGEVEMETVSEDKQIAIKEYIKGPYLFEPESLFGMHTNFRSSYLACTQCSTIDISKRYILDELFRYNICQLNYLNLLSMRAQRLRRYIWKSPVDDLQVRFYYFLLHHCEQSHGKKIIQASMQNLGRQFNETRFIISHLLHDLEDKGFLTFKRGIITIPQLERLAPDYKH